MPLTGFLQGGICYATYDEAMSAKFGPDPVLVTVANNVDKLHFFENIGGAWYWSEYTTTGGTWALAYNSAMPTIGFPSCDTSYIVSINEIFATPTGPDIAAVWGFAFVLPITLYLAAWAYGTLNGMFKHKPED